MIVRALGAGTPTWVVAVLALLGLLVGGLTGRRLADGGYRTEYDEAGPLPRVWWWPAPALALLWAFLAWRIGDFAGWAALPAFMLFAWLAVGLVWIDADVHRLPDGLVLPAYPALLALLLVATLGLGEWRALWRALVCLAVVFALFFLMNLVSPASLGFGDVKLSGLIGLLLGWVGVQEVVTGLVAGFVVGGVVALLMLVGQRVGLRSHIAYGPPLLLGAFVALAFQYQLVA
jgi:leader peptidase (prepilin peptidase) / N-methyltransferase